MQNENEDLGAGFIMFIIIFQESNATHGERNLFPHLALFTLPCKLFGVFLC